MRANLSPSLSTEDYLGLNTTNETIPMLPDYIRTASSVFCALILAVGTVGNALVPVVIWRNRELRSTTNMFLVNLSVADLLLLFICMPTALVELHASKPETWALGEAMCEFLFIFA